MELNYFIILVPIAALLMMIFITSENLQFIKFSYLSTVLLLVIMNFEKSQQLSILGLFFAIVVSLKHQKQKTQSRAKISKTMIGIPFSFLFLGLFINNSVAIGSNNTHLIDISISSLCYLTLAIAILLNVDRLKGGSK
ncbi:MAG: hypothetical protein COW00_05970 [Bdellovibrio sp. CG12_big_fil_rev_8_21_14_0_65_39_13]|nr:MAG: hypothetical protein COW78_18505 [Bdellovibrio sp. CG22_combo_CG10-13_8_21_14_all_39_27]PIQ60777.1 MAG: hypothetical protein COW00_05970 [Bdellovibrio sp. CG12_big_fil_rev_8_21_14_0_65_39_13]PIR36400.1 MAG: hypothetical protein COV37_03305 [Bdellovibrio sp. CG11_big_fil_rev_8_21_14_0_20_39_38]PJB54574.1 MAG: hypothetical protein CO099_00850 [Bdellovibrio sp. CG_4_9_14_3_um_filter_39_7]